jgi:tetratricopeptide (TPR) repeat protein
MIRMLASRAGLAALLAAALLLTLAGCSGEPQDEVWIIGLDGADWDQLGPMMDRGDLPNLAALRDGGAAGVLRSELPMLSPIVWTTIATGKSPDVHGVTWFMTDAPDGSKMPISSYDRQVRAVWDIASEAGLECGVVGWWATWPADPINGWLVSDYVAWHSFGVTGREVATHGKTWPADLLEEVVELMPAPEDIPGDMMARLFHLPVAAIEAKSGAGSFDNPIIHLRQTMATSRGYTNLVLARLADERPAFMTVYYEGTDAVSHLFGDYAPPRLPWISPEDFAAYRDVVSEYWKWQDQLVGELLAERGPRTTVYVVSDHGFRTGDERRKEDEFDIDTADADHMTDGLIIVNGPDVRPGARIEDADLYDVTPTVLYSLGLPVASDMKGRVLKEVFTPERLQEVTVARIATHEKTPRVRAVAVEQDEATRGDMEKMLRSLGYLGGSGEAGAEPGNSVEHAVNLATVLLHQERADKAVTVLEEALAAHPGQYEVRLLLAQARSRAGDLAGGEKIYRELLAENPDKLEIREDLAICLGQARNHEAALAVVNAGLVSDPAWVRGLAAKGHHLLLTGRTEEAEKVLREALALDPRRSEVHATFGRVLEAKGDWEQAKKHLWRAWELDPEDSGPVLELVGGLERRNELDEAVAVLERIQSRVGRNPRFIAEMGAVQLKRGQPGAALAPLAEAHAALPEDTDIAGNLGMAYAMTGNLPEAIRVFELVVRQRPELADARSQLGALMAENNQMEGALGHLREAVKLAPDDARIRLSYATTLHRAGRTALARTAYEAACALDPNLAPAYYYHGQLERSLGNEALGQELIAKAKQLDPTLP